MVDMERVEEYYDDIVLTGHTYLYLLDILPTCAAYTLSLLSLASVLPSFRNVRLLPFPSF